MFSQKQHNSLQEFYVSNTIKIGNLDNFERSTVHLNAFKNYLNNILGVRNFGKGQPLDETTKLIIKFIKNEGIIYPKGFRKLIKQIQIPPNCEMVLTLFGESGGGAKSALIEQFINKRDKVDADYLIGLLFLPPLPFLTLS